MTPDNERLGEQTQITSLEFLTWCTDFIMRVLLLLMMFAAVSSKRTEPSRVIQSPHDQCSSRNHLDAPLPAMVATSCGVSSDIKDFLNGREYEDVDIEKKKINHLPEYLGMGSLRTEHAYIVFANGDEYRGPMTRHGKQQGFGEYWFKDGRHYIGTFEKGVMEGSGRLSWKKHFWDGGMKGALPHGPGFFHFVNGDYNQVSCVNGRSSGIGWYRFKDGRVVQTEWKDGEQIFSRSTQSSRSTQCTRGSECSRVSALNQPNWIKPEIHKEVKNTPWWKRARYIFLALIVLVLFALVVLLVTSKPQLSRRSTQLLSWENLLHEEARENQPSKKKKNRSIKKKSGGGSGDSGGGGSGGGGGGSGGAIIDTCYKREMTSQELLGEKKVTVSSKKDWTSSAVCANCGGQGSLQSCECHKALYCSEDCQRQHWKQGHKDACQTKDNIAADSEFIPVESSRSSRHVSRPPDNLCCPIGLDLFSDPVTAADGETYERDTIERWITDKKQEISEARRVLRDDPGNKHAEMVVNAGVRSPMGFGILEHFLLNPNRNIQRLVKEWGAHSAATLYT